MNSSAFALSPEKMVGSFPSSLPFLWGAMAGCGAGVAAPPPPPPLPLLCLLLLHLPVRGPCLMGGVRSVKLGRWQWSIELGWSWLRTFFWASRVCWRHFLVLNLIEGVLARVPPWGLHEFVLRGDLIRLRWAVWLVQCPKKLFKCFGGFHCFTHISRAGKVYNIYLGLLERP